MQVSRQLTIRSHQQLVVDVLAAVHNGSDVGLTRKSLLITVFIVGSSDLHDAAE